MEVNYFVVDMPLNKYDDGPADPDETVRTIYCVWDSDFVQYGQFVDRSEAYEYANYLNTKETY